MKSQIDLRGFDFEISTIIHRCTSENSAAEPQLLDNISVSGNIQSRFNMRQVAFLYINIFMTVTINVNPDSYVA